MKYTETAQRQLYKLYMLKALRVLDYMDERIATFGDPGSQGKKFGRFEDGLLLSLPGG